MAKKRFDPPAPPSAPLPLEPEVIAPATDAGVALYQDRAGPPINTGLTEGSSNFATITAEARRAAESPET